jgi:hypothetical protein
MEVSACLHGNASYIIMKTTGKSSVVARRMHAFKLFFHGKLLCSSLMNPCKTLPLRSGKKR